MVAAPATNSDGNFVVSWHVAPGPNQGGYTQLRQRVNGGSWVTLVQKGFGNQSHPVTVSTDGKYDFRVHYAYMPANPCGGPGCNPSLVHGDTAIKTTIVGSGALPAPDTLSDQLRYTYATRVGDINADGRKDIYLYRTSGGAPGNGTINKVILRQLSGGKFIPTAAQVSAATAWQTANISIAPEDVNVDGYVDVGLSDVSGSISGALDQIVYAPAQIFHDLPKGLTNITTVGQNSLQRFIDETTAWVNDPNYYEDNKIWVQGPGYWEYDKVCDWYQWGQQWEVECWVVWFWVDGPEHWSYAHFNENGFKLAKAISDVLDGNLSSLPAAIDILEQVLGVDIGGWDFGDWLPGSVSNEQQDAYTLVLSIVSTRDVTNNQTPTCISQNVQYYQDRMNAYIEPADFVQVMNSAIQGNANWQSKRYIYLSGPGVYLRDIEDFGFFDGKHAKAGYAIGNDLVLAITEFVWEQLNPLQGCPSSNIVEDILSNHIGARARQLHLQDPSRTAGRYMRDLLQEYGTLETRAAAKGLLNAAGIPVQ